MERPAKDSSRSARSGGARGFVAARRRRRQQLTAPPECRWEAVTVQAAGSERCPDGTPVWSLQLINDGGDAAAARVVLFTTELVYRSPAGVSGELRAGEPWDVVLDAVAAVPANPFRGYALMLGGDGRWHATTVDGRSASFRSEPDELGVRRTLGLRMPANPAPYPAGGFADASGKG